MKLNKLILKNIRSYEEQEISFPEGTVLLSGEIGSGKTTLLLAIEYALFGLQPGQKGSALLRNGSDLGEVTLEFEIDGKLVTIERKLKRNSKSITNDFAAITRDGERLELSVTELKSRVLEILGYPQEFVKKNNLLYRYTVYTPQEEMKQIILEDSESRLNVLRHVFGVDKYKTIRENLSIVLFDIRNSIRSLQNEVRDIERYNEEIKLKEILLSEMHDKAGSKIIELSEKVAFRKMKEKEISEIEEKMKEKSNFEREVDKTKILITSKKETLSSLLKQKNELEESIKVIGPEFDFKNYELVCKELEKNKLETEKLHSSLIESSGMIASFEQQVSDNISKRERVFKIEMCPTCLQDVSEVHKHNITNETEREISALKKRIALLQKNRKEIMESIEIEKKKRSVLEEEKINMEISRSKMETLVSSRERLEGVDKSATLLERDLSLLLQHIDSLKANILKYSNFDSKFKLKQNELRNAFAEEKDSEISLAEIRKESEMMSVFIDELKNKINEKQRNRDKLVSLSEVHDWLSTHFVNLIDYTERNILLKLRREFSVLFNNWFKMLAGDSFEVRLDENFTPLIVQGENEMDFNFLSGGEKTSVALAYRLALNQIINSINVKMQTSSMIILDEPTDGFSDRQIDKMREVFEDIKAEQILIVSHDQKIEGFVDHIIRLKKEENVSSVDLSVLEDLATAREENNLP